MFSGTNFKLIGYVLQKLIFRHSSGSVWHQNVKMALLCFSAVQPEAQQMFFKPRCGHASRPVFSQKCQYRNWAKK